MGEQIEGVSLAVVLKGIARRKTLIGIATVLGLVGGLVILMIFKPAYQSEAQVIIENLQTPFEKANTQQPDLRADTIDKTVVLSQVSVLKSADIAARVVDKLDLTKNPEFNPKIKGIGMAKRLLIALGFADDPALFTPQELALKSLDQHLTVYQVPDSNVIGIKFSAADKQVASDVANAIAETFVTTTREAGTTSNGRAEEWLKQQIADLRTRVSTSENAVEKYRSEAGLLKGERTTLSNQQISEMNSQIVVAQNAASEAEVRVTEIKSLVASGTIDTSSDVLNSPLIQSLKQSQISAQRRLSELSATYLPNHPKMIGAQADLTNVNNQLKREALKIVESLQSQAKIAKARAASLKADLDRLKGQESTNNISDVKLQELQRNADADSKLLENLLARYADVSARQDMNLQPGMARTIQKALPAPAPYFPKTGPIMMLMGLAGLLMGIGLAFLAEVITSTGIQVASAAPARIHPAQVALDAGTQIPEIPVTVLAAAVVPANNSIKGFPSALTTASSLAMVDQAALDLASPLARGAVDLAETISKLKTERGFKTFSVMSFGSHAPNAAMAVVATARALAAAKTKVIAIDLSGTAQGSFDMMFGLPSAIGIYDLLAGIADFTKVVARDPQSQVHVVRFGTGHGADALTLVQQRMGQVLQALSSVYGVILLHLGEANGGSPTSAASSDVAIMLATSPRLHDAVAASRILDGKGVKSTITLRLEGQQASVAMPQEATA